MRKRLLSDLCFVVATESTREKLQRGTWNHLKAIESNYPGGKKEEKLKRNSEII